jgi:hypothetical protein
MSDTREPTLTIIDGRLMWKAGDRLIPFVAGGAGPAKAPARKADSNGDADAEAEPVRFEIPEDLSTLADTDLDPDNADGVRAKAQRALDTMVENYEAAKAAGGAPSPDEVQAVSDLSAAIQGLKAEAHKREEAAAERASEFEAAVAQATAQDEPEGEADEGEADKSDGGSGDEVGGEAAPATEQAGQPAEPVAANSRRGPLKVELTAKAPSLNPTLAEIAARQPASATEGLEDRRPEVVVTAAADVPGLPNGHRINSVAELAAAATARSRNLGITSGTPQFVSLASVERQFPVTLDEDAMTPQQMAGALEDMIEPGRTDMEGLVAAGGWCAPSEIRYDFFQISQVSGLYDLPTFGVNRGGIRFPLNGGLSLFDFFGTANAPASGLPTNATMPWQWTESDDIAAATGALPTKVCLRPPCPSFDEQRLQVFGICVTAGNLTEDAYPELVRHFIAQTMIAHARVINRRLLLTAAAASTATTITDAATEGAVLVWLNGLDLVATNYREKHGMADGAVLEVIAPSWARGALRADYCKRNGVTDLAVADAQIMAYFNARRLRVQWVQDWQTRLGAGSIAAVDGSFPAIWPSTAQVMVYAPGTFARGNGMRLNLGVTRDSVLNADNDHTAAWSEEAILLVKLGHEARLVTLSTLTAGETGQQVDLAGSV